MRNGFVDELIAALSLVAVVVGAGFASGREVLRFFTSFGPLSYLGCVVAAGMLAWLSAFAAIRANALCAHDLATLSKRSLGGASGIAAAWLQGALVTATAGAMVAAMGEIVSLALPVRGAYGIGVGIGLAIAWIVSARGLSALAMISGGLVPAFLLLYALLHGLPMPETPAAPVSWVSGLSTMPLAAGYAAMNAALGCGVLSELGRGRSRNSIIRISAMGGALLLMLLVYANFVLYPHRDALRDEALPAVQLARALGPVGYWLCIVMLALAVMTTLMALMRTLQRMLAPTVGDAVSRGLSLLMPLLVALYGFETLVGSVYPLLGAVCTLLFLTMMVRGGDKKRERACCALPEGRGMSRDAKLPE